MNVKQEPISRTIIGKVISAKMQKTIIVQTVRKVKHPLYGKYVKRISKMYAHDEHNKCKEGDLVKIAMSHPRSKTKAWILCDVVTPLGDDSLGSNDSVAAAE